MSHAEFSSGFYLILFALDNGCVTVVVNVGQNGCVLQWFLVLDNGYVLQWLLVDIVSAGQWLCSIVVVSQYC